MQVKGTNKKETAPSVQGSDPSPAAWGNLLSWSNLDIPPQSSRLHARPHECKTCNKRFTLLENLNRHQMIHTNQRPFHCPYCSKSFRLSQHLKEHIRIHTGEKPYKCHVCGHAFCQISNLKSHQKTHTKVKGFKCEQCGKEFRRSFTLKQHKLTHAKANRLSDATKTTDCTKTLPNTADDGKKMAGDKPEATVVSTKITEGERKFKEVNNQVIGSLLCNDITGSQKAISTSTAKKMNLPTVASVNEAKHPSHLLSFWNSICRNQVKDKTEEERLLQELPSRSEIRDLASFGKTVDSFTSISKFLNLSTISLQQTLSSPKVEKSTPQPFVQLPYMHSKTSPTVSPQQNRWASAQSQNDSDNSVIFSSLVPDPNRNLNEIRKPTSNQAEKTNGENSPRKRKQAQSHPEPSMATPSHFNDLHDKNSMISRTRQCRSMTVSQDYNWKRQLWREWLDERVVQQRPSSSEGAFDRSAPQSDSRKRKLVSTSLDYSKPSSDELSPPNENKRKSKRCSSSLDDDVFSTISGRSPSVATPRDVNCSNLLSCDGAPPRTNLISKGRDVFRYPETKPMQKPRHSADSATDFTDSKRSFYTDVKRERSATFDHATKADIYRTLHHSRIPSLPLSKEILNPLLKQNYCHPQHAAVSDSPEFSKIGRHFMDDYPLPLAKTGCEYASGLSDHVSAPKVSPDFKSLSGRLSFVPMVTWKPVVTGWRSILDGNVYPARIGVDNMHPFSLQQPIS